MSDDCLKDMAIEHDLSCTLDNNIPTEYSQKLNRRIVL